MLISLEKISCRRLLKRLQIIKNRKLGEAFYCVERLIHMCDMEWSDTEICENLACNIGYDISFWDNNNDDDKDFLEDSEVEELAILLFQKTSREDPEALLDSSVEYIVDNYDIIHNEVSESESAYGNLLNSLKEIRKFEKKHNKTKNVEDLDEIIRKLEKVPVRQLIAIKNVMRRYMFAVDHTLFGDQTNDFSTVGRVINDYMISLNDEFEAYNYEAEINCSMSKLKPNYMGIATLFKCDKSSDIVKVDFKAIRPQYVSDSCISHGIFIGDFNESLKVDINDEDQMKTDICNALNKCIVKLRSFLKTHEEVDSCIGLTETPVDYRIIE